MALSPPSTGTAAFRRPSTSPSASYAPGSPERASLKARLAAMAGETIEIPLVIGGKDIRTGATATAVMPHDHHHVLARLSQGHARARAAGRRGRARRAPRVVAVAVRRSRGGLPEGRRAADDDVARHHQRARRCSGSRRRCSRPRSTPRARSSTSGASTSTSRRKLLDEQPISDRRDLEPGSSTARSRGSSTRSRRSTSRRSPRTCRPRRR